MSGLDVRDPSPAFLDAAAALEIAFDDGDLPKLGAYLALLIAANETMNLTRITTPEAAWERHILDSLTLLPLLVAAQAKTVADIGSGGGAPALPLAIVLPEVEFTLIEATGKKARFLEESIATLDLGNARVVADRAETVGQDRTGHRERYDVVTARAVGPLPVLLELTVPLARVGGLVLAIKGEKAAEEVAAAERALDHLHSAVIDINKTPTGTVVVVEKLKRTGKVYPRRPGEPKRAPL